MLPNTQPITSQAAPDFYDRSFELAASVSRSTHEEEGVLIAQGHHANGWSLFVKDNRLVLDYNLAGRHTLVRSGPVVPLGETRLRMVFHKTGTARADVRLYVGDQEVAAHDGLRTIPNFFGPHSVQVGRNSPNPVSDEYAAPFPFGGALHAIAVQLGDDKGVADDPFASALATE
jgi:arylsulfatase